ncbi:MAG: ErfK/YbiS/YcfS/YnhG family protein [Thermoleophilia bacterium]|nr:ErfK/YbiS/YcfS/YnhG family protein [Thermoleophilia bacterium]
MMRRTRARTLLLGVTALALLVLPAAPALAAADLPGTASWAHPSFTAAVRAFPDADAAQVAKVRLLTEDGYPEVYPVLSTLVDPEGRAWSRVAIPMRPNGRSGWVRSYVLGPVQVAHKRIVVDRTTMRASLFDRGRRVWTSPIGVGAAATPTPSGSFWVREKFPVLDASGPFGPRAIGTSDYSTLSEWPGGGVIGLHGTDQPELIPGRPSHGCIRVPNAALIRLYALTPIGTPITVR